MANIQDQLLEGMTKINDRLYKKVVKEGFGELLSDLCLYQVEYEYGQFRAIADIANGDEPLPGFILALMTMKQQEQSKFWISRDLLSLSKKSDDVTVLIKIISVQPTKHEKVPDYEFHNKFQEAVDSYKIARDLSSLKTSKPRSKFTGNGRRFWRTSNQQTNRKSSSKRFVS